MVEGDAGGGEGFQDTRGDTGGVAVGEERYRALAACRGERGDDVVRYAVGVAAAGGDGAPVNVPPNRRLCLRRLRPAVSHRSPQQLLASPADTTARLGLRRRHRG